MRYMSFPAVLAATLAASGCASQQPEPAAPLVNQALADQGGGATVTTLEHGRQIFTSRCTRCHAAYAVTSHSTIEWHQILNNAAHRAAFSEVEKSALLDYLAAANASLQPPY